MYGLDCELQNANLCQTQILTEHCFAPSNTGTALKHAISSILRMVTLVRNFFPTYCSESSRF